MSRRLEASESLQGRALMGSVAVPERVPHSSPYVHAGRLLSWGSAFPTALLLCCVILLGCTTTGDFRKLEERVLDAARQSSKGPDPFPRIARLSAQVDQLRDEQQRLEGQLEVAQKTASDALEEARKARELLASLPAQGGDDEESFGQEGEGEALEFGEGVTSEEVDAYQKALTAWRGEDHKLCIDRFRKFLQTYPASAYADDGAYWMADCHFKQGDYRVAVLRFNDVVRVYPGGNKAPDALFRQGESLLKLGPGFYDAARTVFEQVVEDYPDSKRAEEAERRLSALNSG